jgi:ABC-type phosphate/phosphonate transport system substrate-binding protein
MADLEDLELIARLQRGGTYRGAEDCASAHLAPAKQYHSVLLARTNSDDWPIRDVAHDDKKITLSVLDQRSTSSFLYPADELIRELGELERWSPDELRVIDTLGRQVNLEDALNPTPTIAPVELEQNDLNDLLKKLRQNRSTFVGTNSHLWEGLKGDNSDIVEAWRSPPIPFDAVVLSPAIEEGRRRDIQRAFLSTLTLSDDDRDRLFPAKPREDSQSDNPKGACERVPDIYAFVDASDTDYDDVRRVAVRLTGGVELKVALARAAHFDWASDEDYFRKVKSALLPWRKEEPSVFLDYGTPRNESFAELGRGLERGNFDMVELNAHEAGRLIFESAGAVVARGRYGDKQLKVNHAMLMDYEPDPKRTQRFEHRLVILAAEGTGRFSDLLTSDNLIAVPSQDSSSAYRYSRYFFDTRGSKAIDPGRFCTVDGARGAVRALLAYVDANQTEAGSLETDNGRPSVDAGPPQSDEDKETCDPELVKKTRFAILPEFEWMRQMTHLKGKDISVVTDDEFEVPNAMLLMSSRFADLDEDLQSLRPDYYVRARRLLDAEFKPLEAAQLELHKNAVIRLREALENESADRPAKDENGVLLLGFRGMEPADKSVAEKVRQVHAMFAPNRLGLVCGALFFLIVGPTLVVWKTGTKEAGTEILTDPLRFGSDRKVQDFIHRAIDLRGHLRNPEKPDLLAKIFNGQSYVDAAIVDLDEAILTILPFYGPEAQVVDARTYFVAMASLADSFQKVGERLSDYEDKHDSGIEEQDLVMAGGGGGHSSDLLRETMRVALEISKALVSK